LVIDLTRKARENIENIFKAISNILGREQGTEEDVRVFGIFPIMEIVDLWRYRKK
jgi:hypothetical protein